MGARADEITEDAARRHGIAENLLRLHRWQLEEQRRYVTGLESLATRLRADAQRLTDRIDADASLRDPSGQVEAEQRPFSRRLIERRQKLEDSIAEIGDQILNARRRAARNPFPPLYKNAVEAVGFVLSKVDSFCGYGNLAAPGDRTPVARRFQMRRQVMWGFKLSAALATLVFTAGIAMAQGAKPNDAQIAHIAYTAGNIDIAAAQAGVAEVEEQAGPRLCARHGSRSHRGKSKRRWRW